MKWTIKNLKTCQGRDGEAFSLTLYFEGKRCATVTNSGTGGESDFYWLDADAKQHWDTYVKAQPDLDLGDGETCPTDQSCVLEEIVNDTEERRFLDRKSKTMTPYLLKGDNPTTDGWRCVKKAWSPQVACYLYNKYKDTVWTVWPRDRMLIKDLRSAGIQVEE